jgi:DNA-binding NarL/FixJ family response regulator
LLHFSSAGLSNNFRRLETFSFLSWFLSCGAAVLRDNVIAGLFQLAGKGFRFAAGSRVHRDKQFEMRDMGTQRVPGTTDKITILLADDHSVVREGLSVLLEREKDFKVIGQASDGIEALRLIEKLNPDVLVADITMPHLNGLEVARQISRARLKTRVVILSMHSNEQYVLNAFKHGARGYVLKSSRIDELAEAIRNVHLGARYLPAPFAEAAVEAYLEKTETEKEIHETLTDRERQVLQMVAEGLSSADIGAQLFISPRTVEVHRAHLLRKLSLRNSADLIRYAFEHLPLQSENFKKR